MQRHMLNLVVGEDSEEERALLSAEGVRKALDKLVPPQTLVPQVWDGPQDLHF